MFCSSSFWLCLELENGSRCCSDPSGNPGNARGAGKGHQDPRDDTRSEGSFLLGRQICSHASLPQDGKLRRAIPSSIPGATSSDKSLFFWGMWKGFHPEQEVLAFPTTGWRSLLPLHSTGRLQWGKLGIQRVEAGVWISHGIPLPSLFQGAGKKLLIPV